MIVDPCVDIGQPANRRVTSSLLVGVNLCLWIAAPSIAQSVPKERRITHREQSLSPYDPFTAEELWKRIKIPPSPFLSSDEALKSFQVAPGFRVECVAAEPLVVDPVMFEFDPDGRIWAVEFRGWMRDIEGSGEADPIGQVVVLEDTDGDSLMDKSTVFLDKLVMPRTVSFVAGGVLVAEPPKLWYCRDTDGDLICDSKEVVGEYGRPGNPEHTDNGLMHAIDNWMYNAKSTVRHKFTDGKLTTESTMFRGQWGITQDDYGRLFYNYENRPLHADLFPAEYLQRNHNMSGDRGSPGMNVDVAVNDHEVFPIRVTPGVTLGGNELRDDGTLRTFTIACGPSIYRGDQFPGQYYGSAVIPEAAGNLVRLAGVQSDGVNINVRNAFERRELLASTDERFRPVCSRTGPDGALYFCDLYRGIIEHVIFMMPYLRNQIMSRGLDKPIGGGRIYRIVHDSKPLGKPPKMSAATSRELVRHLSHPNGWWRDTAQRLLVERKAVDVAETLRELADREPEPLGQLHALWTLDGIGRLNWDAVSAAIGADHAMVRSTAIRLSERFVDADHKADVYARLQPVFADDRPMVRLQLLLTLGEFVQANRVANTDALTNDLVERQIAAILIDHPTHLFRNAAISGLEGREMEFISRLIEHPDWTAVRERESWMLETLAKAVLNEGQPDRVARVLDIIAAQESEHAWRVLHMLFGVLDLNLSSSRWPIPIQLASRPVLLDRLQLSSEQNDKRDAGRLLRIVTWPGDTTERPQRPIIKPLTASQERLRAIGESVYDVTCFSCHKADGRGQPGQAPPLADSDWVNGPPERLARIALHGLHGPIKVNGQTWNLPMQGLGHSPILNDERLAGVLTYVRRAWGNHGDAVEPELIASIREQSGDRSAPWTVDELLNPDAASPVPIQSSVPLDAYRELLSSGNAERGRALFHQNLKLRCNACHKIGATGGGFVGPDLSEVGSRASMEELLVSLVDPSAKIIKGYETMAILTDSGRVVSGTLVSDNEKDVVIALPAGGTVTVAASEIEERLVSPISSMPPVGNAFAAQEIVDLVAYLASLRLAKVDDSQSHAFPATRRSNRLTHLDADEPYYVSHRFPKLTTPMWVGEPDVECVVILSIDDLNKTGADSAKYEQFLRPVLGRLKQIDGRAPVSIFTRSIDPGDPLAPDQAKAKP